jgi:hypothetical protein
MSFTASVQKKDAISAKQIFESMVQEKVDASLAETKVLVAGKLLGEGKMPKLPSEAVKEEVVTEKVITPGSVDHMAHAVHACATGKCGAVSNRGTFTQFEHPDYSIHRDNGSTNPDSHEMNYHVLGAGGHHKFSVKHTSKGVDVSHVGQVG